MNEIFRKFAHRTSVLVGSPYVFVLAVMGIGFWAALGPAFGYSDTWQLVVNTSTTIVTFLMVFVIQNTQNRDAQAVQLKLDELIRSHKHARNKMIDLENLSNAELNKLHLDMCNENDETEERIKDIVEEKEERATVDKT